MRVFLSDIAATVIQGHLDNLYKGMELPGKSVQLVEPGNKPLMDQDKLQALISSKKPEKQSRIHTPFRGFQQLGTQNSTGSKTTQAQTADTETPTATANNHSQQSIFCGRGRVQGASIWTFAQPPHIHQGSSPNIDMCDNTWDRNLGLFRRSPDYSRDEGSLRSKNSLNLFQDCETRPQGQAIEIEYETMSVNNPPGNGYQFSEYGA
ncbi:hypothetical protein AYI70_g1927 [Smittium culicis]|uniref:Uncharacterized protein n=1 Tax=Smittium culicis TaxID=133412 RepID=A0A1R1YAF7_9FUNG|nr:hypothetical protein AYI70_g1927 [Smittium culicis]